MWIPFKRIRCQCTFCGHIWRIPKRRILRFERFFDIKKDQPFVWECHDCPSVVSPSMLLRAVSLSNGSGSNDHEGVVIPGPYKNIHAETLEIDPNAPEVYQP